MARAAQGYGRRQPGNTGPDDRYLHGAVSAQLVSGGSGRYAPREVAHELVPHTVGLGPYHVEPEGAQTAEQLDLELHLQLRAGTARHCHTRSS